MDTIDHLGDAHEALEDCFKVIVHLSEGDMARISAACKAAKVVDPYETDRCSDDPMPAPMEGSTQYGSPWSLVGILRRLVDLGEHYLTTLGGDRHGHEVDRAAVEAAKAMLARLGHPIE
jgi:hypothetical protein